MYHKTNQCVYIALWGFLLIEDHKGIGRESTDTCLSRRQASYLLRGTQFRWTRTAVMTKGGLCSQDTRQLSPGLLARQCLLLMLGLTCPVCSQYSHLHYCPIQASGSQFRWPLTPPSLHCAIGQFLKIILLFPFFLSVSVARAFVQVLPILGSISVIAWESYSSVS